MPIAVSTVAKVTAAGRVDAQPIYASFQQVAKDFEDDFIVCETKQDRDNLPLISFAEYAREGVRRCAANVFFVHALAWDFDDRPIEEVTTLSDALKSQEIEHFWHTTWSHDPDAALARIRMVIRLSRPVAASEWGPFWARARNLCGLESIVDGSCKDPCRLYYGPCGPSRDRYTFHYEPGDVGLDVDDVLRLEIPEEEDTKEFAWQEVPEEERGKISTALRNHFAEKLSSLCVEIRKRPFPGEMYDIKNGRVFALGQVCPHILDPQKVHDKVLGAFSKRYDEHDADDALRAATVVTVEKALHDGMQRPWWPPRAEDEDPEDPDFRVDHTAEGLAERMYMANGSKRLLWDYQAQAHFAFDGKRWRRSPEETLRFWREIGEAVLEEEPDLREQHGELLLTYNRMLQIDEDPTIVSETKMELDMLEDRVAKIYKFHAACRNGTRYDHTLSVYNSYPDVQTTTDEFDTNPYLINFTNGTLDVRTMKMHDQVPGDRITQIVEHDYDPTAQCPRFEQFMDQITTGDEKKKHLLLRAAGYSLLGVTHQQRFVILHGDGDDGKTTFLDVMQRVMGDYGTATEANHFLETKGGSDEHPSWLMDLFGKHFVCAEEPNPSRKFNESLIKSLTGGGMVRARWMRGDWTAFRPRFTLWFAANHLPTIGSVDNGIWRRVEIIEFSSKFLPKEDFRGEPGTYLKDLQVLDALLAEAPGILALLAREAHAYHKKGDMDWSYASPVVDAYREETHPLRGFFDARCVGREDLEKGLGDYSPKVRDYLLRADTSIRWNTERATLYEAYVEWSKLVNPMSRNVFYRAVRQKYSDKKIQGVRFFSGIRLLSGTERKIIVSGSPPERN